MSAKPPVKGHPHPKLTLASTTPTVVRPPYPHGWLRSTRQALGKSQAQVAGKIGVKRQAYANFETGEVRSTISLGSLRRAAEAMDCELVYFLRPKTGAFATPAAPTGSSAPTASERPAATENFVLQLDRSPEELPLQLL